MNRSFDHSSRRASMRIAAASILAVAAMHTVQAQQSANPANGSPNGSPNGSTTTRAAKKAELKKLEQNGYKPQATEAAYPQDVQNAEKKANGGAPAPQGQNGQ